MLGKTFIISHFLLILSVIGCRFAGKFDNSTTKAALAILIPLLMTYTTAVVIDIIDRRHRASRGKNVSSNFTFLILFVPSLFILFIAGIIAKQAIKPDSVEDFTIFLGMGETFFGIYMGTIFRALFTPHFPPAT
jgi:hypothetical protein